MMNCWLPERLQNSAISAPDDLGCGYQGITSTLVESVSMEEIQETVDSRSGKRSLEVWPA